jgi:hypothetical protein
VTGNEWKPYQRTDVDQSLDGKAAQAELDAFGIR